MFDRFKMKIVDYDEKHGLKLMKEKVTLNFNNFERISYFLKIMIFLNYPKAYKYPDEGQ